MALLLRQFTQFSVFQSAPGSSLSHLIRAFAKDWSSALDRHDVAFSVFEKYSGRRAVLQNSAGRSDTQSRVRFSRARS
jgi:hypothetical protein